jgi:hypothetical protein
MMSFFSTFYGIDVRDEIAREFTDRTGAVDDMLAGLHEIRTRMAEENPWLQQFHEQSRPRRIGRKKHVARKKTDLQTA